MQYNRDDMIKLERTMDKLARVAETVWAADSEDGYNAKLITGLIAELRTCATLLESDKRYNVEAGGLRLNSIVI